MQPALDASFNTGRMRHLTDPQGRQWRVHERSAGDTTPTAGRPSLIFDSEGIVRRLWHYPPSWAALSDTDLLGLMDMGGANAPRA